MIHLATSINTSIHSTSTSSATLITPDLKTLHIKTVLTVYSYPFVHLPWYNTGRCKFDTNSRHGCPVPTYGLLRNCSHSDLGGRGDGDAGRVICVKFQAPCVPPPLRELLNYIQAEFLFIWSGLCLLCFEFMFYICH